MSQVYDTFVPGKPSLGKAVPGKTAGSKSNFDFLLDGKTVDVAVDKGTTSVEINNAVDATDAVTINVTDPAKAIYKSGLLDRNEDGKLDRLIYCDVDNVSHRLGGVRKSGMSFSLIFEDDVVARLRAKRGPLKPRKGEGHVKFAERLVKQVGAKFSTPTGTVAKKGSATKARKEADDRREKGIPDKGGNLRVKGSPANSGQRKVGEQVLRTCAAEKSGERATRAAMIGGIVESELQNLKGGHGTSKGVVQVQVHLHGEAVATSVERSIRQFLRKGFTNAGGAIEMARKNPSMSPGEIAYRVLAPDAQYRHRYVAKARDDEAKAWLKAYGGVSTSSSSPKTRAKALVQRGTPEDKNESSWDALQRFSATYGYRCFVYRGTVHYAREQDLILSRARAILNESSPGVEWIDYEWVPNKKINVASMTVRTENWKIPPGSAVVVRGEGPADGRWFVSAVRMTRYGETATIELRRGTELLRPEETNTSTGRQGRSTTSSSTSSSTNSPSERLFKECQKISNQKRPYTYGGGHGVSLSAISSKQGLDCSSSVSLALKRAGLYTPSKANVSGWYARNWGKSGKGSDFTVYANVDHVYIEFHGARQGYRFDTSARAGDSNRERGPRLRRGTRSSSGFAARKR